MKRIKNINKKQIQAIDDWIEGIHKLSPNEPFSILVSYDRERGLKIRNTKNYYYDEIGEDDENPKQLPNEEEVGEFKMMFG